MGQESVGSGVERYGGNAVAVSTKVLGAEICSSDLEVYFGGGDTTRV